METSSVEVKTLGDAIDSRADLSGLCFESAGPITRDLDKRYKVVGRDDEYIRVIPLGDKERPRQNAEPVSILLWQHKEDKLY